jgi:putative membrane protein
MNTHALAVTLHVVGVLVWIAGLFATSRFLRARVGLTDEGLVKRLGLLARTEARFADGGFALAFAAGLALLIPEASFYMHQPWMHLKLTLVVLLVGTHALVRISAKKAAGGGEPSTAPLTGILLLLAAAVVAAVLLRPTFH